MQHSAVVCVGGKQTTVLLSEELFLLSHLVEHLFILLHLLFFNLFIRFDLDMFFLFTVELFFIVIIIIIHLA